MVTVANNETEGRAFYVTVKDGGQCAFLLGPYDTHEQALKNVERARALAEKADHWAHFYAFGTGSLSKSLIALPKSLFGR